MSRRTFPRTVGVAVALAALVLLPGCLNVFEPPPGDGAGSGFQIEVRKLAAETGDSFPLNRTDLQDLLANKSTSDLNGLVFLLDQAATAQGAYEHFVRVKEPAWDAGARRLRSLCEARATGCEEGRFDVVWKGTPVAVTFARSLG